ncbi:contractile injection system protein, VgrG/Pvc8 family [Spirobacillus cienkowskii]|jgi:type VI secretion system secreted protein VgrG|uniref:Gp5/Type VI secretion system Vgr protein OB-fold domain-containing protein n=1 Tax=Spirobacillus cienkowskii TaxID=495820 RepID=A0A369KPK8_9BACT|nr:MAG: hypothetical protein DCC88_04445 [Spirobacillus cienkowskii]
MTDPQNFAKITFFENDNFLNHKIEKILINSLEIINEGISDLFELKFSIITPYNKLNTELLNINLLSELLFKQIKIHLQYQNSCKFYSGIITEILNTNSFQEIIVTVRPYFWLLTQSNGYRCWTDSSLKQIIDFFNKKYPKLNLKLECSTQEAQLARTNIIQYGESDFEFLTKLLHEEGLNFFLYINKDTENIFISDIIENVFEKYVPYTPPQETSYQDINIYKKNMQHHLKAVNTITTSFGFDQRNFGFLYKSNSDFKGQESNFYKENKEKLKLNWQHFNHINKYKDCISSLNSSYPNIISKRNASNSNTVSFVESQKFLSIGETFRFYSDKSKFSVFLVCKLHSKIIFNYNKEMIPTQKDKNSFTQITQDAIAYPKHDDYTFLVNFSTQISKPTQTILAKVFGKSDDDLKIEKDKNGLRIGICFLWQEELQEKECSPFLWARLSQFLASQNSGSVFIPKPGDEIIVTFANDDIEQPIVIGCLYNSKNTIPQNLNEKNSGIAINLENDSSFLIEAKDSNIKFIIKENQLDVETGEGKISMNAKNIALNKLEVTE